jgi:hypothetical protein
LPKEVIIKHKYNAEQGGGVIQFWSYPTDKSEGLDCTQKELWVTSDQFIPYPIQN